MSGIFYKCFSLKNIEIYNFNSDNVRNMEYTFKYRSSLKEIILENFNTKNKKKTFFGRPSPKKLYIVSSITTNILNVENIFDKSLLKNFL